MNQALSHEHTYLHAYLTPLAAFLQDPGVVEVAVNPDGQVWVERSGEAYMEAVPDLVLSARDMMDMAQAIAGDAQSPVSSSRPLVSGKIVSEGRPMRVQVLIPPAVEGGPSLSVRLFGKGEMAVFEPSFLHGKAISLDALRQEKMREVISCSEKDLGQALQRLIELRLNVVVSGGTSTGKTTFARQLLRHIDEQERIITIEDAFELFPPQANTVCLLADRAPDSPRTTDQLLAATLRLRPDRIIVGELRGREAITYLEAINTGHGGSITTLHAETARLAIDRLAMMVLQAETPLTFAEVKEYISRSIDVIVQLGRHDGKRGVTELFFPGHEENGHG